MVIRNRIIFLIFFAGFGLFSCMNPMASIENKKVEFRNQYSKNHEYYKFNGQPMHVAWSGDSGKRPILFIHGSPGSFDAWSEFLVNKDLQQRFHLLAVDRPGYGSSGKGQTERSLKNQSDAIFAALQFNKSGLKPIIIGHSFGGAVVARMMIDEPDKIGGAIFVAASVDPHYETTKWYQYVGDWKIFSWAVPDFLRVCNEEIMALNAELENLIPLWKNTKTPTVIIQGDQDDLVAPQNEAFLQKQIDSKYIVKSTMVPGLNHFVPWNRPDLILEGIELLDKAAAN